MIFFYLLSYHGSSGKDVIPVLNEWVVYRYHLVRPSVRSIFTMWNEKDIFGAKISAPNGLTVISNFACGFIQKGYMLQAILVALRYQLPVVRVGVSIAGQRIQLHFFCSYGTQMHRRYTNIPVDLFMLLSIFSQINIHTKI